MKIDDEKFNEIFNEENQKENTNSASEDAVQKIEINNNFVSVNLYDWVNSIIVAVIAVVLLLTFCFRLIDVDGISMEPTLINTDKVIISNLFYTPNNGDVVVISHGEEYDKPLIKRVIATEGQSISIDFENNKVYVEGQLLDEPYIQGDTIQGDAEIPEVVPEGKVFVLGDNRARSLDSRYLKVGLIDETSIIGKAQFVIIPHSYRDGGLKPMLDLTKIRYIYK